jgi:hypothetical protein
MVELVAQATAMPRAAVSAEGCVRIGHLPQVVRLIKPDEERDRGRLGPAPITPIAVA